MRRTIIGVDEVGRGALAGPVVCAAVVLPEGQPPWLEEIRDSKKISPKKRQFLAEIIMREGVYAIREGPVHQVDTINILQTTLRTMYKSVVSVCVRGNIDPNDCLVLVDGQYPIPGLPAAQEAIKGGDGIYKVIGAASIVAKAYRDNYMSAQDKLYPEYGFAVHKGYGTLKHREAIMVHGPCKLHRKTFRGVYEYVKKEEQK